MSTLNEIADGIVVALNTISTLRSTSEMPDQVNPPQAILGLGAITNSDDFSGSRTVSWTVLLLLAAAASRTAQRTMRDALDRDGVAASISAALEADGTLSGTVDAVDVMSSDTPQTYTVAEVDYYGVEIHFETYD